MATQIGENELLEKLGDKSRNEMAEEIGYKDAWKKIGLHFTPEVKYDTLKARQPHLFFMGGDIAYCKAMIDALADQKVTLGQFITAVDAAGLKASAANFRAKYVSLRDMMVEVVDYT